MVKKILKNKKNIILKKVFLVVIDDSHEQHQAIRFACLRAKSTNGRVALLKCISPAEFQHFAGVAEIMRSEARENAEKQMRKMSEYVLNISGEMPILFVREGDPKDELISLINGEDNISSLILGMSTESSGPGPLVSFITSRGSGIIKIPITLVPGDMTDSEIDSLT